ncbi:MAG: septum formation initiator family protein [Bacteroidaceae bacterium]|nr:septum formation initiator family protein [Bacteroidaceae bacterium]MBR7027951.1 septum formation initiator family protein [Bacteroidaceae bacterium]
MAEKLSGITRFLIRFRYVWVILLFIVIAGFVDPNSFLARYRLTKRNNQLRAEIQQCDSQYAEAERELRALQNDPRAVERVARVHLFMKSADEDVYVVEQRDTIAEEAPTEE